MKPSTFDARDAKTVDFQKAPDLIAPLPHTDASQSCDWLSPPFEILTVKTIFMPRNADSVSSLRNLLTILVPNDFDSTKIIW